MTNYVVNCPIVIERPRSKNWSLNLNEYRNAHFQTLNGMKKKFKELVKNDVDNLPFFNKIRISYVLYPKTRRLVDTNNVVSVVDKFFCDALVELGKLQDDNFNYVIGTSSEYGEVDSENPRVEATIEVVE